MTDDRLGDGVDPRVVETKAEIVAAQQQAIAASRVRDPGEQRAYMARVTVVTAGLGFMIATGVVVQPSSRWLAIGIWVGSVAVWFTALLVRRPKAARV